MKKKVLAYLTIFGLFMGQMGGIASANAEFIMGTPAQDVITESAVSYAGRTAVESISPDVESHTIAEIRAYAKQHPVQFLSPQFDQSPSLKSPFAMGKVKAEVLQDGLNALNLVRYVAGLSHNVTLDDEYTQYAQAASLVNGANGMLSHSPECPAGMDESLYLLGKTGAGKSNLSAGRGSLAATVINGYLNDGDANNVPMVGHRRWILNPTMGKTGFGIVTGGRTYGTFSAMYAFDRSGTKTGTVSMWPALNTPVELFGSAYPWSYSTGYRENADNVQVTLTNVKTGEQWIFKKNTEDGYFNVNNEGYAMGGCIIFRPSSTSYSIGDKFHVLISGLSQGKNVEYDVNFFELNGVDEEVNSISINASTTTIHGGSSLQLTISYEPETAVNKEVKWTSDNPAVATVDGAGIVHGIKDGTATIKAETVSGKKQAVKTVKVVTSEEDKQLVNAGSMFRLYNPNSGEHFYTGSLEERNNLAALGWNYEGVAWRAPRISSVPVYRLYNPYVGDHHYTTSAEERDNLIAVGWLDENVAWYSDEEAGVPMYRLFNPNAVTGMHHYTASEVERDQLVRLGWRYEGVGWYGLK